MVDQPFTTWQIPALSPRTTARTEQDRIAEVFNVKDFGAIGNGSTDDTIYINAAVAAFKGSAGFAAGTLYFPPGNYRVTSRIDIGGTSGWSYHSGRVCGAGQKVSIITGDPGVANANTTIAHDAVVNVSPNNWLGPQEFCDLTIINQSTVIGSVGLRFCQANGIVRNCNFNATVGLDLGVMNTFNMIVEGCSFENPARLVQGSVCIMGSSGIISGTHFDAASGETGILMCGQCVEIRGCSFENVPIGMQIGVAQGLATQCTISGGVLTVLGSAGNFAVPGASQVIYPDPNTIFSEGKEIFKDGDIIYGTGIPPNTQVTVTGAQASNTSGLADGYGTYNLSGAGGITISTPQAIIRRRRNMTVSGCVISACESEANGTIVHVDAAIGLVVQGCNFTGVYNQAPAINGSAYQVGPYTTLVADPLILAGQTTVNSPASAISINGGNSLHFDCISGGGFFSQAAFKFYEAGGPSSCTFTNCFGNAATSAVTDTNSFIDNGAGATAVTNATTSTSSNILHFSGSGGGVPPSSMPAGTPVYNVTTPSSLAKYAQVVSQTSTTVTLAANVSATVGSGDTIKFGVPSGVAGHVLTVCGLSSSSLKLGGALSGTGVPTGRDAPFVADQIPYGFGGDGGLAGSQYNLGSLPEGAAISLNLGRRQITENFGAPFACHGALRLEDQLGVGGIVGGSLTAYDFSAVCGRELQIPLGVILALTSPAVGQQYDTYNCPGSGGGGAAPAPTFGQVITAAGSASFKARLRYNGVNWTVMGV